MFLFVQVFSGPKPHWMFGNFRDIPKGQEMEKGAELIRQYGPAFRFQIGPFIRAVILTNHEYIQAVMNTNEPKDPLYHLLRPWIGDGLLLSSGKKWARNRRLLTPAFHFEILKPYQRLFSESTMALVNKWKAMVRENPRESVEMFEHVSLFTLDSLMKCIFSKESKFQTAGKKNPYIKAVYELTEIMLDRARYALYLNDWIFYFSYLGYRLRRAVKIAHDYSMSVIEKKRKAKNGNMSTSTNGKSKYLDFLDMLLDCKDEEGKGLTDQEIQDEVDTFMFEGHDTTASGISWCLYNLACHPEYQEKCRQEVLSVLTDGDVVTWDNLSKLPYLTQCIKESLRSHPPVPRIGRMLTKPVTLPDGRVIPGNTYISLSIYGCQHDPNVWPDPDQYNPERFNIENSAQRRTQSFVPFSAGPRNCIGQNFAMNEMKTVVAIILKHFRLAPDEKKKAVLQPSLILRSKDGVWLKLDPLKKDDSMYAYSATIND